VRANNEDAWMQLPSEHFYALADGMGGRNGGAIASAAALKVISEGIASNSLFKEDPPSIKKITEFLKDLILEANEHVWGLAQSDSHLEGMGTTLCCLRIFKKACLIANVGDSRIYRLRQDALEQLTHDDSLVADLLKYDLVDDAQAKKSPLKHVITKSIGTLATIEPTLELIEVEKGDLFMLCSDGLSNYVSERQIESILSKMATVEEGAHKLVQAALDAGGLDNVTVVLVAVD
jgi:protein phosphatase